MMRSENGHNQPAKIMNKTQAQIKAEKRAAALRDNLKKRKVISKDKKKEE